MPALGSRKGYQYTVALRAGKAGWTNGIGKETKQSFPGTLVAETMRRTIATMWFGGPTVLCWMALSSPTDIVSTHASVARAAQGPEAHHPDLRDPVAQDLRAHPPHLRDPVVLKEGDHPYTSHLTVS